jgi:FlaA1/EpsC-like NDP-sugar epimerase
VQHVNRRASTAFSLVRFGNVLGSAGSVIDTWRRQLAEGGPVTVTHPDMTRYFMTIPEAASLVIQSAALVRDEPGTGEVYLLDMGEPVKILDLAAKFIELHGLAAALPGGDPVAGTGSVRIVFTGPRPGEKMHEQLARVADDLRPTDHPDINIWELAAPSDRYMQDMLRALDPAERPRDPVALARVIRRQVPEMVEPTAA